VSGDVCVRCWRCSSSLRFSRCRCCHCWTWSVSSQSLAMSVCVFNGL